MDQAVFIATLKEAREAIANSRPEKAETCYLQLLETGMEREGVLGELCQLYLHTGQRQKAIKTLHDLLDINPRSLDYLLRLASECDAAGLPEDSIAAYRKALAINANLPNSLFNMARQLKKLGQYREAAAAYELAIERGVSSQEEVYNNLALVYSELQDQEASEKCLQHALSVNPDYIPAIFNLASLEEERGHKDAARRLYEQVLSIDGNYFPALSRLAYLNDTSKADDPLITRLRRALQQEGVPPLEREELGFALGKVLDECGEYDAAFAAYQSANNLGRRRFRPYDPVAQERLVDSIIATFDREWYGRLPVISDLAPVFICGMLRSGSTLLERVLAGHSRVRAGGELEFIPRLVKQLGDAYPLSLPERGEEFLRHTAQEYQEFVRERLGNPSVFTDKRPDNFLHLGLIKSMFPEAKILWTRRGVLDNCLSIYFQQLGGGMSYSVDLESIGHYYRQQVRLMDYWKSLFPDSIQEVHYEEFVQSPRDVLGRVLGFLGLDWEDACLDFTRSEGHVRTASIWQVRKPLYQRSSGRFVHYRKFLQGLGEDH
ncbi:tetratricopeptide repeat-containing sulfotransferase family protein [Microbulbifer sediminum]|uniref:tetratricopeptide repeat-containing sulfotransferase family protein n=1 Tax=Microbulbifer sediminum TaxID=2904250 RepID=UPI001F327A97|nr:tetratricopeptide repeat-containing sulfotransferase family protein [Microbulbifer sediminum]